MQVKKLRTDFVVREVVRLQPSRGRHALYSLSKSGFTTGDAIGHIAAAWNIPRDRIQHAGMKDRHAETMQSVTIPEGPTCDLELPGVSLNYLGQVPRPIVPQDIVANEFRIVVRRLSRPVAERMQALLSGATLCIPNYFDDQRFGSVGYAGTFIAHAWCLGNYERALYLALAEPNPHDRPADQEQKEILRQHWSDWETCKARLERSHTRSVVTYLVDHPTGFKKAVGLIRRDLRSLYVAAFQSKLWNEVASRYLQQSAVKAGCGPNSGFQLASRVGEWFVPSDVPPEQLLAWQQLRIPLPSGRKSDWPDGTDELLDQVLSEQFQMERYQLRLSYPRDVFFARGGRELLLRPSHIVSEVAADETRPAGTRPEGTRPAGTRPEVAAADASLRLQFSLPAAQYATMLVKVLEAMAGIAW